MRVIALVVDKLEAGRIHMFVRVIQVQYFTAVVLKPAIWHVCVAWFLNPCCPCRPGVSCFGLVASVSEFLFVAFNFDDFL